MTSHLATGEPDPSNPDYEYPAISWKNKILEFIQNTEFKNLEIIDFHDGDVKASVTFIAYLEQGGQELSLKEKSHFEKVDGQWLYLKPDFST